MLRRGALAVYICVKTCVGSIPTLTLKPGHPDHAQGEEAESDESDLDDALVDVFGNGAAGAQL